ncbi:MAG TPA: glycosyltransferase, partial [Saprospiraceae bacterium]|nr:glycosyltransferase [Saprospiraceae bacterium]
ELCVVKKPVLFVPYPFAAEDHQTANARQLLNKSAALMIKDTEAADKLVPMTIDLARDDQWQFDLKRHIAAMAISNADKVIAHEIMNAIG